MNTQEELVKALDEISGRLSHLRVMKGRRRYAKDEDLLLSDHDPFIVDSEMKIAQSKGYRRLLEKTQVVTDPHNAHIRKRITHASEVAAIASFIASTLGLNHRLAYAIALGHDLGHAPFGHAGEHFLRSKTNGLFRHEVMSVVIAQHVERSGRGLNLTHEVLAGIVNHKTATPYSDGKQGSEEAKIVKYADKMAYVTGDYNDLHRLGAPIPEKLREYLRGLGPKQRHRVNRMIVDLCKESAEKGGVSFDESDTAQSFWRARKLMFHEYKRANFYDPDVPLERIFKFIKTVAPASVDPVLVLALMTDRDVVYLAEEPLLNVLHFKQTSVWEIMPILEEKEIKWWDPDLEW